MYNCISNEMKILENESDRIIDPEHFYIVRISLSGDEISFSLMKKWGLRCFKQKAYSPSSIYIYSSTLFLIFPCCVEDEEHCLGGSHHSIVSYFTRKISTYCSHAISISTSIIEFESKIKVLTYLSHCVYSNNVSYISTLLKSYDDSFNIGSKTRNELLDLLKEKGCVWEEKDNIEKYGIFFRLNIKKGKNVVSSLSELVDWRDNSKYLTFILG